MTVETKPEPLPTAWGLYRLRTDDPVFGACNSACYDLLDQLKVAGILHPAASDEGFFCRMLVREHPLLGIRLVALFNRVYQEEVQHNLRIALEAAEDLAQVRGLQGVIYPVLLRPMLGFKETISWHGDLTEAKTLLPAYKLLRYNGIGFRPQNVLN